MTGMWEPTDAETEAGLKGPHDFCTFVAQVGAAYMMRSEGAHQTCTTVEEVETCEDTYADMWNSTNPYSIDSVADGSLGWAAYQMTLAFDLDAEDDEYDLTCYDVEAWPAPEEGSYTNLYLDVIEDTSDGAADGALVVVDVPYHTIYSFFQEGDYKRAAMDANAILELADDDTTPLTMAERRTKYDFDANNGMYCMYWDNWDGMNPQPWGLNDCGIQALWLND